MLVSWKAFFLLPPHEQFLSLESHRLEILHMNFSKVQLC
jgi:hypothetical protein